MSVVVRNDYIGHFTNENRTIIVEGTILPITRLYYRIATVITCMTENYRRVGHEKKYYSKTYEEMMKLGV